MKINTRNHKTNIRLNKLPDSPAYAEYVIVHATVQNVHVKTKNGIVGEDDQLILKLKRGDNIYTYAPDADDQDRCIATCGGDTDSYPGKIICLCNRKDKVSLTDQQKYKPYTANNPMAVPQITNIL